MPASRSLAILDLHYLTCTERQLVACMIQLLVTGLCESARGSKICLTLQHLLYTESHLQQGAY